MSALLQRTRRGPGPLILIVLVLNAARVLAHDPGLSALEVSVNGNEIAATLSVSPADVASLAPQAAYEEAVTKLREVARDAVRLAVDGEPLVLEWQHVDSDQAGARIRFAYVPVRSVRRLSVTSNLAQHLPRGHRQLLTVNTASRVVGEAVLDAQARSLSVDIGEALSSVRQAWSFVTIGIHHILAGYDHLMFLGGLILAAGAIRQLLVALTAFTVAHAVSLALAVVGGVHAPSSIVEPLIAASIAWVGIENLRSGPSTALRASPGRGRGGATRWWIVFGFGLIHGFGFAGALTERGFGSSPRDIAVALLSFNLGVELGQLATAAVILPLVWIVRSRPAWHARLQPVCSMIIVAAGTGWLIERIL